MKLTKRQLQKLISEQFENDDDEFDDPELARFTVVVYQDGPGGEFWVNFEDELGGGSGNDPLDGFENTLRSAAERTLQDLQRS
jgi:hypothetical protein